MDLERKTGVSGSGERSPESRHYPVNAAHLMRTTQLAQLQLSAMADHKASILMGATFVIFTITIGRAQSAVTPLPLLILGAAAFVSAVFAILAVLPATRPRKGSASDNLLFFGVFTDLSEEEFIDEITARLATEDQIYRTMARDIHQAGMVLRRKKYRMLGYAYTTFLGGLVASCIAYVIPYLS